MMIFLITKGDKEQNAKCPWTAYRIPHTAHRILMDYIFVLFNRIHNFIRN